MVRRVRGEGEKRATGDLTMRKNMANRGHEADELVCRSNGEVIPSRRVMQPNSVFRPFSGKLDGHCFRIPELEHG